MSSLYLGAPGAGKSYGLTRYAITPALEKRRRVVTNIPLKIDALEKHCGFSLDGLVLLVDADQIRSVNFWFSAENVGETITKAGDLIVIDEAHEFFGTDQKIKSSHEVFRALRFQRKYVGGEADFVTDIIFATQSYRDICSSLRGVMHSVYYMHKQRETGAPDTFRVDVFGDARKDPVRQKPVRQEFGKYDAPWTEFYDSYSVGVSAFASDGKGDESEADDRINIWNQRYLFGLISLKQLKYAAMIAAAILIPLSLYLFFSVVNRLHTDASTAPPPEVAKTLAPAESGPVNPVPAVPVVPAGPRESARFRLIGFYVFDGVRYAVISAQDGRYRYLQPADYDYTVSGPAQTITYKNEIIGDFTGVLPQINNNNENSK